MCSGRMAFRSHEHYCPCASYVLDRRKTLLALTLSWTCQCLLSFVLFTQFGFVVQMVVLRREYSIPSYSVVASQEL